MVSMTLSPTPAARRAMDIITNPSGSRNRGPRHDFSSSSGPDVTRPQWQHRPPRPVWPWRQEGRWTPIGSRVTVQTLGICIVLGVSRAKDINSDAGCCWAMYPDIALGSSPAPDNNMDQCGNTGHLGQHGHSCSTVLGHQCGHRLWPRHWASMQTLVAPWTTDIIIDPGRGGPQTQTWPSGAVQV